MRSPAAILFSAAALSCLLVSPSIATSSTLDRPTFVRDVAPILFENCVGCHAPGQIAPMSLRSYEDVRPWAKSIARNVADRQMPPWDADPGYGPFANDRSLSDAEIETLVGWVEAGAPRGEGEAPKPPPVPGSEWTLGEPDWVIEFDPVEVAAEGPDQFVNTVVPTGFEEDRWIRAVEVLPGDQRVVHHVLFWVGSENGAAPQSLLGGWAAGGEPFAYDGTLARLVRKGHPLIGDFHYHPSGEAATDRTRIGVWFADPESVEKEVVNLWILNTQFEIPPGAANAEARASHVFPQDSRLIALTPHLHYRGKDFSYTATFPDGRREELLRVSRYDFNWQTTYTFEEPVAVPAGTRINCVAHWDNSPENPANPDPTATVRWGPESTDEMLIGFVDFVVDEGVSPRPISAVLVKMPELAERFPGAVWRVDVDTDGDGTVEPSAVHLPRSGDGGWYVAFATTVMPAPIREIVWHGSSFEAKAYIPGRAEPLALFGVVDGESGALRLSFGSPEGATIDGVPAEEVEPVPTTLPGPVSGR